MPLKYERLNLERTLGNLLALEVTIVQQATGLTTTESVESILSATMERSVTSGDALPIVTIVAAMTRAFTKPVEFEINGYLIKVNKDNSK